MFIKIPTQLTAFNMSTVHRTHYTRPHYTNETKFGAKTRARMPRKELLPSRSSFLRTARNFLKELPRNKDGEELPRGTSLRRGGKGWRARKFLKERRGRMERIFLDARKFLASRKFLEIRMAIEELP